MPTKTTKSVNKIKTRRRAANVRKKCQDGGDFKDAMKKMWMQMRMEKWLIRTNRIVPLQFVANNLYEPVTQPLVTQRRIAFDDQKTNIHAVPASVMETYILPILDNQSIVNLGNTSHGLSKIVKSSFVIVTLTQNLVYGHNAILLNIASILNKIKKSIDIVLGNFTFRFQKERDDQSNKMNMLLLLSGNNTITPRLEYLSHEHNVDVIYAFLLKHVKIQLTPDILNKFSYQENLTQYIYETDKKELKQIIYTQKQLSGETSSVPGLQFSKNINEKFKNVCVGCKIEKLKN